MDKSTMVKYLGSRYEKKSYSDHNFPTPLPIVDFVESKSNNTDAVAERNPEWLLNGQPKYFLSDCPNKEKVVKFIKEEADCNVVSLTTRDLNIQVARGSMDLTKLSLRTNYPFTSDSTGNLRAKIWPDLMRRDWDRGYQDVVSIQDSAWALADTSNTGSTNKDIRHFIMPKLEWFVWNSQELFKPHATVQTCTTKLGRTDQTFFDVYDHNFNLIYRADKATEEYIFKTLLTKEMVDLQKNKFGQYYTTSHWALSRNQFPKTHYAMVPTFSIDKDGNPTKHKQTNLVDSHFGLYRVGIPLTRNSTKGDPWFKTMAVYQPTDAVRKDYTYFASSDVAQVDSFRSLFQTEFVCVLFEDTLYSRTFTGPTTRFIGQFPLDRIWTTAKILKFLNNKDRTLQDRILERYSKGFNADNPGVVDE